MHAFYILLHHFLLLLFMDEEQVPLDVDDERFQLQLYEIHIFQHWLVRLFLYSPSLPGNPRDGGPLA